MGLLTYPLGIRSNVALAEPRTSMCIPQQGLLKGCNGVRLKVYEKRIKAQDLKYKPPGCASRCIGMSVSLRFLHSSFWTCFRTWFSTIFALKILYSLPWSSFEIGNFLEILWISVDNPYHAVYHSLEIHVSQARCQALDKRRNLRRVHIKRH